MSGVPPDDPARLRAMPGPANTDRSALSDWPDNPERRDSRASSIRRGWHTISLGIVVAVVTLVAMFGVALAFGYQPATLTSDSMYPALRRGDIVFASPQTNYQPGDVITFFRGANQERVTHRIVDVTYEPDGTVYTTKGDASRSADTDAIRNDDIVGSVRHVMPFAGTPALWLHNPSRHVFELAVLALIATTIVAGVAATPPSEPPRVSWTLGG